MRHRVRDVAPLVVGTLLLASFLLAFTPSPGPASAAPAGGAQEGEVDTSADDELLAAGAEAYTATCSGCHQPAGVGLPPQFPPLIDNPRAMDADYVRTVIANGLSGEIEVNGTVYDGVMPAFSTLPDDDVEAIVFYLQSGFAAPSTPAAETPGVGVGGGLPDEADFLIQIAFLIAAGVGLFVLLPRITSQHGGDSMPWLDAALKAAIIVAATAILTVFVPNWALNTDTVQSLDRNVQDFVGTSLWVGGVGVVLAAVWYASRERRI